MTISDPFYARGFKAYKFYIAVKLHATTDYDIHRYNAAVNVKEETFLKRNDKYWFAKLGKTHANDDDLMNFFVANWIETGELNWIGKLTDMQAERHYLNWKRRQESLGYTFSSEMNRILDTVDKPADLTKSVSGTMPPLMSALGQGTISIETLVILDAFTGCLDYMSKQMTHDEYVWPKLVQRVRKYAPFVTYDKAKFRVILKAMLDERLEKSA